MKSTLLSCSLLVTLFGFFCQKTQTTNKETASQLAVREPIADAIVRDTVRNKDGVQLAMAFNNTKQTATFVLNGEVLELKLDTLTSGIKYSNSEYEYREHQGKLTLKKGDKIVFSKP